MARFTSDSLAEREGLLGFRIASTKASSRNACVSGPPTRLGASASNKRSAFVVEPEGANEPSARHQMKKAPMGPFSFGGEGGIRTLDTGLSPYNALAGRHLRPLGHLSVALTNRCPTAGISPK